MSIYFSNAALLLDVQVLRTWWFATRFKRRQHIENITDDDEFPVQLFNYPCSNRPDRVTQLAAGMPENR